MTALRQWGADYLFDESEPRPWLIDLRTQTPVSLVAVLSAEGQPVDPEDTQVVTCEPDGAGR